MQNNHLLAPYGAEHRPGDAFLALGSDFEQSVAKSRGSAVSREKDRTPLSIRVCGVAWLKSPKVSLTSALQLSHCKNVTFQGISEGIKYDN